jgi:hypothetical protein
VPRGVLLEFFGATSYFSFKKNQNKKQKRKTKKRKEKRKKKVELGGRSFGLGPNPELLFRH